jgi:serine protease Do
MARGWTAAMVLPLTLAAMGAGYATGLHAAKAPASHAASAPAGLRLAADVHALRAAPTCPANQVMTTSTIPNVVAKAEPAVVTIYTTIPGQIVQTPFGQSLTPSQSGVGSGFLIRSNGLILTNDHVVAGASSVQVRVNGYKERFTGTVVGTDYSLDLALVKIQPPKPLPTLPLATGPAPIGSWVVAIGAPEGLYNTVTVGVISASGRSFTLSGRHYTDLLQTDAPINPGNSGGPLLNLCGQVVGINTAVNASGQGLGFAIPASQAQAQLNHMMQQHLQGQGWLGVIVTTVTPQVAQQQGLSVNRGALVVAVEPQSPAAAAGIRAGDVIVEANGKAVPSANALTPIIEAGRPGSKMTFVIVRAGQRITVTAVLQTRPTLAS